jgi:hypothetical protein
MSKTSLVFASAVAVLFSGCAASTIPYQQPDGLLWGFTEDSLVRSDVGRVIAVSKTRDQCERSLAMTHKQANAENSRYSECRQMVFGGGDPYWVFTFPPHILLVTAFASANRQTCENLRRQMAAKSGVALSPCTSASLEFK